VDEIGKAKYRPALVISNKEYNKNTNCCVFLTITSAKHSESWQDYTIQSYTGTNLQGECIIRFKFFTLEQSILKGKIGELNSIDRKEVIKTLDKIYTFSN